jgi:hypothetical protein
MFFRRASVAPVLADRAKPGTLRRDERGARSAEWIEDDVSGLGRVTNGAFDQCDRLHGRVEVVLHRLIQEPHIPLVAITAPIVIGALLPAIQERFILALIIRTTEREGVLRPDHEGGPLAAGLAERLLQVVEPMTTCTCTPRPWSR